MSTASANLTVRGIDVEVVYKDIKNLHIGVYPPAGRVRVAAPKRLDEDQVRLAVIQRLPWIKRQQQAAPGCRAAVRAGDGHRRVPLRLGQSPTGSGSSSGPAGPTSKSTATACCCTCRRDTDQEARARGARSDWHRDELRASRPAADQPSGSRRSAAAYRTGASSG